MAEDRPISVVDDFLLEEHSGESAGDEAASGLEMDDFQAKEIRQIFLTTLPDYLDPVAQMLEQAMSAREGHEEVRRALQTTLSSISAAASRVGIHDVCNAVEVMRDQLLALEDEPIPASPEFRKTLHEAFAALQAIAGGVRPRPEGGQAQTIVLALQNVDTVDKSVLERLTAAGLVTVDQLRIADPQEIVAVTGLDPKVVHGLLEALLGKPARQEAAVATAEHARRAPSETATAARSVAKSVFEAAAEPDPLLAPGPSQPEALPKVPERLAQKLRSQVDIEASVDELRAGIMQARIRIAAWRERFAATERNRARLQNQLSDTRQQLSQELTRLTATRLLWTKLESERALAEQALDQATRHLASVKREYQKIVAERASLAQAIAALANRIARVRDALPRS